MALVQPMHRTLRVRRQELRADVLRLRWWGLGVVLSDLLLDLVGNPLPRPGGSS